MLQPGFRGICVREVQRSLKESAKLLIEDKIREHELGSEFEILDAEIRTPGSGLIAFQGMQDHTAESVKSLEGFDVAWWEEAQSASQRSLTLLRPTIRKDGSELWFSWNPTRKGDAIEKLFRNPEQSAPTDSIIVKANWTDNPWFPAVLEQERRDDLKNRPEQYAHIWDGDFEAVTEGAYFAKDLAKAKADGRIGVVPGDPLMTYRAFWDIGGTGAKADACAIWVAQFIKREILVLDYYEAVGQPLSAHVQWLRTKGYDAALCVLPHDGDTKDRVHDVSFKSALEQASFATKVIPNQGRGAAKLRIEAARRLFPRISFNAKTCQAGLDALGAYHEKHDDHRSIGLGPDHDWASHGADAFGLMCVAYEEPVDTGFDRKLNYQNMGFV